MHNFVNQILFLNKKAIKNVLKDFFYGKVLRTVQQISMLVQHHIPTICQQEKKRNCVLSTFGNVSMFLSVCYGYEKLVRCL